VTYIDDGYVYDHGRTKRSVVICTIYHGPRPSPQHVCAHRNDIKDDDRSENLYWATPSQNAQDAIRNGKMKPWHPALRPTPEQRARGERLPHKLTEEDVLEIRSLHASGKYNMNELAYIYGVSNTTIRKIVRRLKWAHV
jgi:hypothetical protein